MIIWRHRLPFGLCSTKAVTVGEVETSTVDEGCGRSCKHEKSPKKKPRKVLFTSHPRIGRIIRGIFRNNQTQINRKEFQLCASYSTIIELVQRGICRSSTTGGLSTCWPGKQPGFDLRAVCASQCLTKTIGKWQDDRFRTWKIRGKHAESRIFGGMKHTWSLCSG